MHSAVIANGGARTARPRIASVRSRNRLRDLHDVREVRDRQRAGNKLIATLDSAPTRRHLHRLR
jgi:hypothetical protein